MLSNRKLPLPYGKGYEEFLAAKVVSRNMRWRGVDDHGCQKTGITLSSMMNSASVLEHITIGSMYGAPKVNRSSKPLFHRGIIKLFMEYLPNDCPKRVSFQTPFRDKKGLMHADGFRGHRNRTLVTSGLFPHNPFPSFEIKLLKGKKRFFVDDDILKRIEYVTPFKASRDAETLLFGRSRDYYSTIGLCHPSCGGLRSWRVAWELRRSLPCRLDKGMSKVDVT
ncbi:hypothetical protein TNCV_64591 [Trichonephila clavipes]|nr:hypothetical protein TNCV_64591 [Trichonephila clavipes]